MTSDSGHISPTEAVALRPSWWLVEVLVAVLLAGITMSAVSGWRAADEVAANAFPEALSLSPQPRPAGGYMTLTAARLNRQQPSLQYLGLRVRYVDAEQASPGPNVVSVNPVNASSWGAVARGSNGRCFATLVTAPGFHLYYAEFPARTVCDGRLATPRTVTRTAYPTP